MVESTKSTSLGNTGFLHFVIKAFVFTGDFVDIIDNVITLSNATISETPAIVDITSILFPSMFMHSHRDSVIEPVGTTSRHNALVGSIFLHRPVSFAVNISILTCEVSISISDKGTELLVSSKIVILQDIGINFRFEVGTRRHNSSCNNSQA